MAGPSTHVQDGPRWLGEVLHQLVVEHVGADLPLHGLVRTVYELVGKESPGVIAHGNHPDNRGPKAQPGIFKRSAPLQLRPSGDPYRTR